MRIVFQRFPLPLLLLACNTNSGDSTMQPGETDSTATVGSLTDGGATDPTDATPGTTESVPTGEGPTSEGPSTDGPATDGPATDGPATEGPSTDGPVDTDTTVGDTTEGLTATTGDTDTDDSDSTTGPAGPCEAGEQVACYSGPEGTDGVAACKAGVSTCDARGEWGACVGEVLPAVESCETRGDEDCDGVDPCVGETSYAWHKVWGEGGKEGGMRLGYDATGALVVLALGSSTSNFGGEPLPSPIVQNVYLAKFAPDGKHLWSKVYGDSGTVNTYWTLGVEPGGDIVVAGGFTGKIDFGGNPLQELNNPSMVIAKLTGDGAHVWSESYFTGGSVYPGSLALGPDGSIILGGQFNGEFDLGGGEMKSAGGSDGFVGKLTAAGEHVWSIRFGDSQYQYVTAVGVGPGDKVIVGGSFEGAINLGNGPLVSKGGIDIYVSEFSAIGNVEWAKSFGDAGAQSLRDLAVSPDGRLTAIGQLNGKVDFGGGALESNSNAGLVFQLEPDGSHRWSKLLGDDDTAYPDAIVADKLGNLLLTGYFNDTIDLGGGPLVNAGGGDVFSLKLGPAGNHVWSMHFGDNGSQRGFDTAVSATGDVAICGEYTGAVNFGGGPNNSKGGYDGFLAVFKP